MTKKLTLTLIILLLSVAACLGVATVLAKYTTSKPVGNGIFNLSVLADNGAFSVYSADDDSLTFYRDNYPAVGEIYNGKTVTAIYKRVEAKSFTPAWSEYAAVIKSVEFFDEISPQSLDGWFTNLTANTKLDLAKLTAPTKTPSNDNLSRWFNGSSLGELILPGNLTKLPVQWLEKAAYRSTVTSIVVPKGVTYAEAHVFKDAKNLTTVTFLSDITSVERRAFQNCSALTEIRIISADGAVNVNDLSNVTRIDYSAFSSCSSLKSMKLSEKLTNMGNGVFSGCTSLETVNIPAGMISLDGTFNGCKNLTSIDIPDSVTRIIGYAFSGTGLTALDLSHCINLTEIGEAAFHNTKLTRVILPPSLGSIARAAFESIPTLTEITIPESVTTMSASIFSQSGVMVIYCSQNSGAPWGASNALVVNNQLGESISLVERVGNVSSQMVYTFSVGNGINSITVTNSAGEEKQITAENGQFAISPEDYNSTDRYVTLKALID